VHRRLGRVPDSKM